MAVAGESRGGLRVGVLISGGGSTLRNLIERIAAGTLRGIEIAGVISSRRDAGGVQIARAAGLDTHAVSSGEYRDEGAFSSAIGEILDRMRVDLVVMAGFLRLWRIPANYRGLVINIHPALLPAFGGQGMHGAAVHAAVLASGATQSGCTVHLADEEYDHGPILAQQVVPLRPGEDAASLAERVMAAERELYPRVLQEIADRGVDWLRSRAEQKGPRET